MRNYTQRDHEGQDDGDESYESTRERDDPLRRAIGTEKMSICKSQRSGRTEGRFEDDADMISFNNFMKRREEEGRRQKLGLGPKTDTGEHKQKRTKKIHSYCGSYNWKCHKAAMNIEATLGVKLKHPEFAVLSALALHMNTTTRTAFPSEKHLAKETKLSLSAVRRAIRSLQGLGPKAGESISRQPIIKVHPKFVKGTEGHTANEYTMLFAW
jgi:hypothetical protein